MKALTGLLIVTSLSIGSGLNFQLILPKRNECICPGVNLVFECNVTGGTATVFKGDFIDCSNGELVLLHSRYNTTTNVTCNNKQILAQGIGVVNNTYISQLQVRLTSYTFNGNTISCIHDNGTEENKIGDILFPNFTAVAPLPPPKDISWKKVTRETLSFQWSHDIASSCSSVKYNILQSNCGDCPNTTVSPNVTCTNVTDSTLLMCMFSVQTVVCENITGEWSSQITLNKSDNFAVSTGVTVGSVAAVFTSVIVLLGITFVVLGIKRKRKSLQQQSTIIPPVPSDQLSKDESDRPKPKFRCVSTNDLGSLGYSLCESDYDNITVSNYNYGNYSHLEYTPCKDLVKESCGHINRGGEGSSGCVRHEDESLDLENLLVKLRGKIKGHWHQFGLTIGVPKEALSQLVGYDEEDCLVEILDYWLKNHPDQPTWKELADAMEDLRDYELATSILKVYNPQEDDNHKPSPALKYHEYVNECRKS